MTTKPFEEVQKFTLKALSKSDLILTLQQKGSPQECCQLMEGTHLSAYQPVIGCLSFLVFAALLQSSEGTFGSIMCFCGVLFDCTHGATRPSLPFRSSGHLRGTV